MMQRVRYCYRRIDRYLKTHRICPKPSKFSNVSSADHDVAHDPKKARKLSEMLINNISVRLFLLNSAPIPV